MSEKAVLKIIGEVSKGPRKCGLSQIQARRRQVDPMGSLIQSTCNSGRRFFHSGRTVRAQDGLTQAQSAEILSRLRETQSDAPGGGISEQAGKLTE
jgi:hypothetical protein